MPDDRERLIRKLFAAYLANDRQQVSDALAEDFRFTSPFDDDLDKATYFERCWRDTGWIARHDIEAHHRLRELRGRAAPQHRPHHPAHQQWRLLRLRPRLLGP